MQMMDCRDYMAEVQVEMEVGCEEGNSGGNVEEDAPCRKALALRHSDGLK